MLKGYLLMETDRNYVKIAQAMINPQADGQDLQQFMSDSPWQTAGVFEQVRQDIGEKLKVGGGMLNFDESGDDCSGIHKAGAKRQYLGRHGKVDMGQVGVLSSYYKDGVWVLTDGELYLPESWFKEEHPLWADEAERFKVFKRLHIPVERVFESKIDLARAQFDRALASKLDFEVVGADSFYGRDTAFRRHVASKEKLYMLCVPKDTAIWLQNPMTTVDEKGNLMQTVSQIAQQADLKAIAVRPCERGMLTYDHAFVKVWTQNPDTSTVFTEEILVIRRENDGSLSFALSNGLSIEQPILALWRSQRYFVERTIQDTKSELGWDELQALKYRAYMHTLALCAMALVFMADIKIDQRKDYVKPIIVKEELNIPQLPDLSLANVKELLKSIFPLPQLSKEQAVQKVINTLFKRAKATQHKYKINSS
jgi:SRSO17 transposase